MTTPTEPAPSLRQRVLRSVDGPALDLAVFRVTVAVVIAASASVRVAVDWAELPAATRVAPLGVGWLIPHLPITPTLVAGARALLHAACLSAALGVFSRTSFALAALCAAYVLLIPQLGGAVFHDHHLLWFALLLAASPCGDALSVDAWRARRRGEPRPQSGPAHGLALRVGWLLVGLIYFFPGVHKLRELGLDWVLSDNLQHQLWWKWAQDPSLLPRLRVDRYPALLHALAGLTVLFELSFVVLVFFRRTRLWAVAAALAFHAGTHALMGIDFSVLYLCYTLFLPWSEWVSRWQARSPASSPADARPPTNAAPHERVDDSPAMQRALRLVAAVGLLLVAGVGSAGALGAMQAYPFACYPTFAYDPGEHMPSLVVDVQRPGGPRERLPGELYRPRGQRGLALEWRLAGAYGDFSTARLSAWWRETARDPRLRSRLAAPCTVRFARAFVSVDPDQRASATGEPRDEVPLLELPCEDGATPPRARP